MWWMWNRIAYSCRKTRASFGACCALTTICPRCTCSSKPQYDAVRTRSPESGTGHPACHALATCVCTDGDNGRIDEKNGEAATTASAEARKRTGSLFQPPRFGRAHELGEERPVPLRRVAPGEMAGGLDDLESRGSSRECVDHLACSGHRRDRIEVADTHERRTFDALHAVEHVEALHRLEAAGVQLAVHDGSRALFVPGNPPTEKAPAWRPLLRRHRRGVAAVAAPGDRGDLVAAEVTEV